MDRAQGYITSGMMAEERACMGDLFKNALVFEQFVLVGINRYRSLFIGVCIVDKKPLVPIFLSDTMYKAEMRTAIPALKAFECHLVSPLSPESLPDGKNKLHGDQDDNDPFKEIGVLDPDLIRKHRVVLLDHLNLPADALTPLAAPEHF